MKSYKVRIIKDFNMFHRWFYSGWEIIVSEEVFEQIKDMVEVVEVMQDANEV